MEKICEQLLLQFLLLTVNISFWVLVAALNSIDLLQRSSSRFKKFFLGCLVVDFSFIWKKKKKISWNGHSLTFVVPLVVIPYHPLSLFVICLLSLVVPFVVPLVVICCLSLSRDVPLVCLFINDLQKRFTCRSQKSVD